VFVVATIACISLRYHSFNFHRTSFSQFFTSFPLRLFTLFTTCTSHANSLTYWHRPHTSKTRLPILFIHGIGVGLYPYINFLADINAHVAGNSLDGQVGIIAIEIMSVSSRITYEAMLKDEMCDEIRRILTAHEWEKCVLVSHS
jgi:pimeloyl-ACP methyl ester carboxylesterase